MESTPNPFEDRKRPDPPQPPQQDLPLDNPPDSNIGPVEMDSVVIPDDGEPPLEKAQRLDAAIRDYPNLQRKAFVALGRAAVVMKAKKLYKLIGHPTFESYLDSIRDRGSRSQVWRATGTIQGFWSVPDDVLERCSQRNLRVMLKMSEKERQSPEMLERAQKMKTEDLVSYLNKEKHQHLETKAALHIVDIPEGAMPKITKGLFMARLEGGLGDGAVHYLEVLTTLYLDQMCDVEEYKTADGRVLVLEGMSNEEAYDYIKSETPNVQ